MIITIDYHAGDVIRLDLREQLGDSVELECFQFVVPPIEFRLVRNRVPLQDWQPGNTRMYDLQHPSGTKGWSRDEHQLSDELQHRPEHMTCGVLCKDLVIETTGLAFPIVLLVWPRESTCRMKLSSDRRLPIL
jgi:hypothetical protein